MFKKILFIFVAIFGLSFIPQKAHTSFIDNEEYTPLLEKHNRYSLLKEEPYDYLGAQAPQRDTRVPLEDFETFPSKDSSKAVPHLSNKDKIKEAFKYLEKAKPLFTAVTALCSLAYFVLKNVRGNA